MTTLRQIERQIAKLQKQAALISASQALAAKRKADQQARIRDRNSRLIHRVLCGFTIAKAARAAGVSAPTAKKIFDSRNLPWTSLNIWQRANRDHQRSLKDSNDACDALENIIQQHVKQKARRILNLNLNCWHCNASNIIQFHATQSEGSYQGHRYSFWQWSPTFHCHKCHRLSFASHNSYDDKWSTQPVLEYNKPKHLCLGVSSGCWRVVCQRLAAGAGAAQA
jgi:hypothetical protein